MESEKEMSFKEKRVRELVFLYYSREDVKKALFDFSKNRECVPRYFEGFGKRPDSFQYESDILEQVRKGATSFHCSEELWKDPLEISTDFSSEQFNEIRIGWDLLIDIDSPYLEYSKIYADLIVRALEFHGVKNIGVKFSGSKGLHIIIPWKAFPQQIYGQKTTNMFPEWPRTICEYLTSITRPQLADKIFEQESLKDLAEKTGKKQEELLITECLSCHRSALKKFLITWLCPNCKNRLVNLEGTFNNRKKPRCPECRTDLQEISRKEICSCDFCQKNSEKNPENFAKARPKTESLIEADLVLVAPRHLFRMPYSLHEKTALSSIVIDKNKIKEFQIKDANALKVEIKNFYPNPKPEEAKQLLLQALDWKEQRDKEEQHRKEADRKQAGKDLDFSDKSLKKGEYKQVEIPNPLPEIYPPCIKLLLNGVKDDGRKRALFILINFFKSLGTDEQKIIDLLEEWNKKNYNPLKRGYIQSQLNWYRKKGARMPPNCDKTNYRDLNVCFPDELCRQIKNPVNYAIKKYFKGSR